MCVCGGGGGVKRGKGQEGGGKSVPNILPDSSTVAVHIALVKITFLLPPLAMA